MAWPSAFIGPIGPLEFALIAAVGLLLFGKRLPEVGRQVGKSIVEFKRGLQQLKREVTDDPTLREARGALNDLRQQVQAPQEMLRTMRDPVRMLENLTQPDLATPGPQAHHTPPPAASFVPEPPPAQNR
jgi:TatA/E family protein of Tat protein translocase